MAKIQKKGVLNHNYLKSVKRKNSYFCKFKKKMVYRVDWDHLINYISND